MQIFYSISSWRTTRKPEEERPLLSDNSNHCYSVTDKTPGTVISSAVQSRGILLLLHTHHQEAIALAKRKRENPLNKSENEMRDPPTLLSLSSLDDKAVESGENLIKF